MVPESTNASQPNQSHHDGGYEISGLANQRVGFVEYSATCLVPCAWLVIFVAALGCSKTSTSKVTEANLSTTRAMADFYGEYCREHGGRTPPDKQAFRDYLANKQELLQRANLTPDAMFVSPRENGVAIQWVYGKAPPNGPMGTTIIAYETSATDGRRFVLTSRGFSEFLGEPQFQAAFPTPP